jgi:hypothetical protein
MFEIEFCWGISPLRLIKNLFYFENAWLLHPSFLPFVLLAWHQVQTPNDAAGNLTHRLKSVRAAAKVWSRCNRVPLAINQNCKFIILLFDTLEEDHSLSTDEI